MPLLNSFINTSWFSLNNSPITNDSSSLDDNIIYISFSIGYKIGSHSLNNILYHYLLFLLTAYCDLFISGSIEIVLLPFGCGARFFGLGFSSGAAGGVGTTCRSGFCGVLEFKILKII